MLMGNRLLVAGILFPTVIQRRLRGVCAKHDAGPSYKETVVREFVAVSAELPWRLMPPFRNDYNY